MGGKWSDWKKTHKPGEHGDSTQKGSLWENILLRDAEYVQDGNDPLSYECVKVLLDWRCPCFGKGSWKLCDDSSRRLGIDLFCSLRGKHKVCRFTSWKKMQHFLKPFASVSYVLISLHEPKNPLYKRNIQSFWIKTSLVNTMGISNHLEPNRFPRFHLASHIFSGSAWGNGISILHVSIFGRGRLNDIRRLLGAGCRALLRDSRFLDKSYVLILLVKNLFRISNVVDCGTMNKWNYNSIRNDTQ